MTVDGGIDPNSGLPVVAPGGGNYSLRIGDGTGANGAQPISAPASAEGIRYIMQITPQNAALTYMYAVVICEADQNAVPHPVTEAARFEVILKNQLGVKIDCGSYNVEATSHTNLHGGALYKEGNQIIGKWWYSNWTNVNVNLKNYIGQTVTLEFRVADCNPGGMKGGHGAYAYIDMKCGSSGFVNSPVVCANTKEISLCAPAGGSFYNWEQLKKITGTISDTTLKSCLTITNPAVGEVYKVSYKSSTGCDLVITDTLKGLQLSTIKSVTLCPKQTPTYQLKATVNTTNKVKFNWSSIPAGFTAAIQNPVITTPFQNTLYVVTATDTTGNCSLSDTIRVTSSCDLRVTATNATICLGHCVTLPTLITGGTPPYKYKWEPGSLELPAVKICPTVTTIYTVTVTDSLAISASATATIIVKPLPDVKLPPFTVGVLNTSSPEFDLTGGTPVGGAYSGKGVSAGKFNPAVAGVGTHMITYTYSDNKDCINSATQSIVVSSSSDISDLLADSRLSIYPNPHTQSFILETTFEKTEYIHIQLLNLLGEVVITIDDAIVTGNYKKQVNTASLPAGIYFLSVKTATTQITKKVIKN